MTDYFVDFSLSTNGDGSVTSPWNQFTTSEHSTISGGDDIWFRRIKPGNNNKIVTFLAGDDSDHIISYIGWPINGDYNYNTRPTPPSTSWDSDSKNYTYQEKSTNTYTLEAKSNIIIHRFYIKNTYTSITTQRAIVIKNKSNVTLSNCYITSTYSNNNSQWYYRLLDIENSSNIDINNCSIEATYYYYASLVYNYCVYNCDYVTFSGTTFYMGSNATSIGIRASYMENKKGNYIYNTNNLSYYDCYFDLRLPHDNMDSNGSKGPYLPVYNYIESCSNVVFKRNTFTFSNTLNNPTSRSFKTYPTYKAFEFNNSTISSEKDVVNINHNKSGLAVITNDTTLNYNNLAINCPDRTQNIAFEIHTDNIDLTINTISGSMAANSSDILDTNYLFAFTDWEVIQSNNISITNVPHNFSNILDLCEGAQVVSITNTEVLSLGTLYITALDEIKATNQHLSNIRLHSYTQDSNSVIHGGVSHFPKLEFYGCSFYNNPALIIHSGYFPSIDAIFYNNTGANGIVVDDSNNSQYTGKIKAIRNNNFSGFGNIAGNVRNRATESSLNSFDYGKCTYNDKYIYYSTSDVNRTNGAGYSINITKKLDDGKAVHYPIIGEDNIWVHIPEEDTYTITMFATYTSTTGSFTGNDVQLQIDVTNNTNEIYTSSTIVTDTNSTWNNITSGTNIKMSVTFTTSFAQYCPVKVVISKWLEGMNLYVDPKLTVLAT